MFSLTDNSLDVVSLPVTEPEISPDNVCAFSETGRSSIWIRQVDVPTAQSAIISLQMDDTSSIDQEIMTMLNLTTRLVHTHDFATSDQSYADLTTSDQSHSDLATSEKQSSRRKRRQLHSANELKLAVIRWKNSLNDAKYLLDNGMASDSHRAKLLDDLDELYQHRHAVACLSSKDSDVVGLAQILRFHCHKSAFGPTVRNLAIDILDSWTRKWFGKGLREKSQY